MLAAVLLVGRPGATACCLFPLGVFLPCKGCDTLPARFLTARALCRRTTPRFCQAIPPVASVLTSTLGTPHVANHPKHKKTTLGLQRGADLAPLNSTASRVDRLGNHIGTESRERFRCPYRAKVLWERELTVNRDSTKKLKLPMQSAKSGSKIRFQKIIQHCG